MSVYTGSCLCGTIALEISGGISAIIHCHCSKCRKSSGTAFATNGFVASAGLRIISGASDICFHEIESGGQVAVFERPLLAGSGPSSLGLLRERHGQGVLVHDTGWLLVLSNAAKYAFGAD